jgi:hypothetical protein
MAMKKLTPLLASVIGLATCAASGASATDEPALQVLGKGVQIYSCQPSVQPAGTAFAWKLKGPEAVLLSEDGKVVGKHFAGPSWQANDGSTIVGEAVVASPAPAPGAIPWLVLHVKSSSGAGLFANVAYVTRTATKGGAAPASGCDAADADAETKVAYSATYSFFPQKSSH